MTENEIKGLREGNEKRKVEVDMKVDYTLWLLRVLSDSLLI